MNFKTKQHSNSGTLTVFDAIRFSHRKSIHHTNRGTGSLGYGGQGQAMWGGQEAFMAPMMFQRGMRSMISKNWGRGFFDFLCNFFGKFSIPGTSRWTGGTSKRPVSCPTAQLSSVLHIKVVAG